MTSLTPMTEAQLQRMPYMTVTVPGDPVPKARPRYVKNGVYTPRRTSERERVLTLSFRRARVERNEHDELGVRITFRASTRQRRDIDNCVKLVLDAANGVVWRDDVQVVHLEADMHRGVEDPSTTVEVWVVREMARYCEACGGGPLTTQQDRFCSKGCYDTKQRRGLYRRCAGCGKDVYRQAGKADAKTVYCTPQCRAEQRGKCRQCGEPLRHSPSLQRVFCTPACSSAWYRAKHKVKSVGGTCACGAPMARRAKQCRACFLGGAA